VVGVAEPHAFAFDVAASPERVNVVRLHAVEGLT
jgi:hypothetical protein